MQEQTAQAAEKSPRTPNRASASLAELASSATAQEALENALEIIAGLGARPERITLNREGNEVSFTSKTRQLASKFTDIDFAIRGGSTRIVVACAGQIGAKLRGEVEAVLRVAALAAELCARKLWEQPADEGESCAVRGMVGNGDAMHALAKEIRLLSKSSHPVLVTGERGTGKTTLARAIYEQSPRRATGSFVELDCTSLTENLLESELFGYEKGAFTGAGAQKKGLFDAADKGVLFLDEIAELTPALQVKLLKVVEQGKFRRVGGTSDISVNVRIIAATSRDLALMRAEGQFREELYDRLSVLTLRTVPLREKREDIPALVLHRLSEEQSTNGRDSAYRIEEEAVLALQLHAWPGNVRELQGCIARLALRVEDDEPINVEDVHRALGVGTAAAPEADEKLVVTPGGDFILPNSVRVRGSGENLNEYLARVRAAVIDAALEATGNNQKAAARILGTDRNTLRARMRSAKKVLEGKTGGQETRRAEAA